MVATLGSGHPGTLLQYLPVSNENIVLSVQYESDFLALFYVLCLDMIPHIRYPQMNS